jgi:hypothetical protein
VKAKQIGGTFLEVRRLNRCLRFALPESFEFNPTCFSRGSHRRSRWKEKQRTPYPGLAELAFQQKWGMTDEIADS